jgi:predicted RNA-binding protein with PIN domain
VKGHNITVVFDGHGGISSTDTKQITGGVTVIFSRIGKKADDVIKELILKNKGETIVITSDREIIKFSWTHGAIPVSSEIFIEKISGIQQYTDEYNEEDEYNDIHRKTSKRLSKKQRAIKRALKKL